MISLVSATFLTVMGILFCFGFVCMTVVFCCCAHSSLGVFSALLCCSGGSFLSRRKNRSSNGHVAGDGYQTRNRSNAQNPYNSGGTCASTTNMDNEIMLAEAFLVAPLAEATIIRDNSSTHDGRQFGSNQVFAIERGDIADQSQNPQMVFKDIWAAILFVSQVVVIIWFAVDVSLKSMKVTDTGNFQSNGLSTVVAACVMLGAAATIMGTLCLTFILRNAEYIIEGMMWINIAVCAVGSILCLASGGDAYIFAAVLGLLAAVNYWYLNSVRPRIAFASAVLSVACKAVKDNYVGTIISAYLLVVVQLSWFILWSMASYGVVISFVRQNEHGSKSNGDDGKSSSLTGGQTCIVLLLMLSLHWGSEVVRTLLQTTVDGVIACWWFQPDRKSVVQGALFRSVTTSFGSVCFGSLIVAFIQTLKDILTMFSHKRESASGRQRSGSGSNDFVTEVANCLLGLLEQAVMYFNKYAYCYVAGYGMGFIEAAKKVRKLFIAKGWTAIINDNLVGNALSFAMLGMTFLTALLGFFSTLFLGPSLERVGISDPYILLSILGGLMGFAVAIVLTNALSSGVAMVFVCMAEGPDALKDNHPQEFLLLTTAWSAFHPDSSWAPTGPVPFQSMAPQGYIPIPHSNPTQPIYPTYPTHPTQGHVAVPYHPTQSAYSGQYPQGGYPYGGATYKDEPWNRPVEPAMAHPVTDPCYNPLQHTHTFPPAPTLVFPQQQQQQFQQPQQQYHQPQEQHYQHHQQQQQPQQFQSMHGHDYLSTGISSPLIRQDPRFLPPPSAPPAPEY